MDVKTRNIIVGVSYSCTIIFSYIGLMVYNSEYQAIDNSYIILFCLFEALFLRMALGPIIVPIKPKPQTNIVSTSKKLPNLLQKNKLSQINNKNILLKPLVENYSEKPVTITHNTKNQKYLMNQKNSSSSLSANTSTQTLPSTEGIQEPVVICVGCQAQIPGNTNTPRHCPFCTTLLTKPVTPIEKNYSIAKEKLFNRSLVKNASKTLPKQTTKEIFSNKRQTPANIPVPSTSGTRSIDDCEPQDIYTRGEANKHVSSLEIGETNVGPNKNIASLECIPNTTPKNEPVPLVTSLNDKLVFDRLTLVTERLEQKRQEIEQKWRKNNTKILSNNSLTLNKASTEQKNDTTRNIQCAMCNKILQLHITRQNTNIVVTLNNNQLPLFQMPTGYSLILEHVNTQPEELHQLFLTFNTHLELLSQEVTIVPSKTQNAQKIDEIKEVSSNPMESFLPTLKYPCRLCRQEFSIGDHYSKTKYESTNHTEIIHIRTSHQTAKQTENHEAIVKIDLTQKTLLNMPEINVIASKPEQQDDSSMMLTT